jgi:hypothetical protein
MIQFIKTELSPEYREKWNVNRAGENTFYHLCDSEGNKLNYFLYRLGWMSGDNKPDSFKVKHGYIMAMKQIESLYPETITKVRVEQRHLADCWCIINIDGIEKVLFKSHEIPYLSGGIIYSLNNNYYNIETGEFYCHASTSFRTKDFLFLNNFYDSKNPDRQGVMKLNIWDGTFEIFPEK